MTTLQIRGVIPPVVTPFRADGEVDYEAYVKNLARWNSAPLAGYLVLGSNGETAYLSEEEKLRLLQLTVETAAPGRLCLAGTGLESTRATLNLTSQAARLGADAALILTPCYYGGQMTDSVLIHHYTEIADRSAIPIMIYNVPKFTHLNVSVDVVRVLSQHPNIVGMKDSSGDMSQLVRFQRVAAEDFTIAVGTASGWYPALALGARAGILALANCCPDQCARVQELFDTGEREAAQSLFRRLFPVNAAVTALFGIPGLKHAMTLLGFDGGCVRSPLQPLSQEQKDRLREVLVEAELLTGS